MSEAGSEEGAEDVAGREIWIEKYRPRTLEEVVGQDDIVERLQSYIDQDDLPHLLFAGPAGTGKCVTGDTPILTGHGVERMADVVGDADGFTDPPDGLEVLTLDGAGEFEFVEPSHAFGKETGDLLEVRTRDGNELTITPEHRLLVVDSEGLDWKPAADLSSGDRIARPSEAPLPATEGSLDWMDRMDGHRTLVHVTERFAAEHGIPAEEDYVGGKKRVVAGIRRGDSDAEIADRADTTTKVVREYRRELEGVNLDAPSTVCSLSYLRDLDASREELRRHVVGVQYVTRYNRRSGVVSPPWSVTPSLAAFVGLAVSEARIKGGRIKFYNTDPDLLDQFEAAAAEAFGVTPTQGTQQGVPYRAVDNRTVTHFLESCFDCFDGATGGDAIGSAIVRAPEDCRRAFLRAVFDAEAHMGTGGIIELTQKNGQLVTLLSYLLAGAGVPSRRKTERKAATNGSGEEREYHVLYVSGAPNLRRFRDRIGFSVDRKADRLATHASNRSNPNDDTIPAQSRVDDLCETLFFRKGELLTRSLDPETPGRQNHLDDVERVLEAATAKIETVQATLERLDRVSPTLDRVAGLPASWVGNRESLRPIATRRSVAASTDIRSDRLLEYADGRRSPGGRRAGTLLAEFGALEDPPDVAAVQDVLRGAVDRLGVPYARLASGTDLRGTDVANLLRNDDHDLRSLPRFATVAERIESVARGMLSTNVVESLRMLDLVATADLYYDEVESVEPVDGQRTVYDLAVPGTRNYVAGAVPTVMHNTTCATAIAREIYGEDWRENFLELNASDQRGIDVVRDRIKNFARSSFGGYDHRVIFLDEADSLTDDAQSALRRTMEQFSDNTRFILSCNYSSRIIDPIQSRCAVFRFGPLPEAAVAEEVRTIADAEGIDLTADGVEALTYVAGGDMRRAINALQAAATTGETVDEEAVYRISATARPEEIEAMVRRAIEGDFAAARGTLDSLLREMGMAGGDVIDQLHRSVWEFDLDDRQAARLLERVGEADYRITAGANEQVQLEALLAALALEE